jgi:protein SCO1/2
MKTLPQFLLAVALIAIGLAVAQPPALGQGTPKYQRSEIDIRFPDITVINQDGKRVKLGQLLNSDKPILVDFVYATCTTICPVLSAGFANLQRKLGAESQNVHLISISIDPEHDNPEVMKEYLERYQANPGWDFYTGKREEIYSVMKAFNVFVPDKMQHLPVTFLRKPGDPHWIRIYGLVGTSDLMAEYRLLLKP